MESRAAGDNSRLMLRQKFMDKKCRFSRRGTYLKATLRLLFFGENPVARTSTDSYFFGNFTDS